MSGHAVFLRRNRLLVQRSIALCDRRRRKAPRGLGERRRVECCDADVSLEISHIERKDVLDYIDVHGSNKAGIINFDALDFVVAYNLFPSGVDRRNVGQQS